ncbi:MAG TPA: twin-arginine translocase TatA/TatE family subunit [Methylococcaceae bacterium]|nr:twin-arginine translocase TatA/TatE family subunit [Methylococcaceae bacterium]
MGIGVWELVLLLLIVLVLFGTKKLKTIGGDLGGAIKGFRKALSDEEAGAEAAPPEKPEESARKEKDPD